MNFEDGMPMRLMHANNVMLSGRITDTASCADMVEAMAMEKLKSQ